MTNAGFWEQGYTVVRDLLGPAQLAFAKSAMDASNRTGKMRFATKVVPQGAMNEYSPIGGEALLMQCRPAFEAITGRKLIPAYAFWRIYQRGAELRRHVDRNSCEISASLPIHAVPAEKYWPIHVCDLAGTETSVPLVPGDAILYQGLRIPHWREPLDGEAQYQVFLHYVIADGDHANMAFDGRKGLKLGLADHPDG
jgi:hypothetical protein